MCWLPCNQVQSVELSGREGDFYSGVQTTDTEVVVDDLVEGKIASSDIQPKLVWQLLYTLLHF